MILAEQQEQYLTHVGGANLDDTHEKMLFKKAQSQTARKTSSIRRNTHGTQQTTGKLYSAIQHQ